MSILTSIVNGCIVGKVTGPVDFNHSSHRVQDTCECTSKRPYLSLIHTLKILHSTSKLRHSRRDETSSPLHACSISGSVRSHLPITLNGCIASTKWSHRSILAAFNMPFGGTTSVHFLLHLRTSLASYLHYPSRNCVKTLLCRRR